MPSLMIRWLGLFSLAMLASSTFAMSVRPPQFDELVQKAEAIVRGEVVAVSSEWRGSGSSRRIITLVRISVERCLLGGSPRTLELEFLGGRVGEDYLLVPGQPEFRLGEKSLLFIAGNGQRMCPLVHAMHGRLRIVAAETGGGQFVAREDGVKVSSLDDFALPLIPETAAKAVRALKRESISLEEMEQSILARANALGRKVEQ